MATRWLIARRQWGWAPLLVALAGGCSSSHSTAHNTKPDMSTANDLSVVGPDLISTPDLTSPPDLGPTSVGSLTISTQFLGWSPSCGTAQGGTGLGTKTITLNNTSSSPISVSLQFASGATSTTGFAVSPSGTQTVAAMGQLMLTVTPPAAPGINGINAISDALDISFTDANGQETAVVGLSVTPTGVVLALVVPGGGQANIGNVPVSTSGTLQLQIINTGNVAATGVSVSAVSPTPATGDGTFSVASPTPATGIAVPANDSAPVTVVASYAAPATDANGPAAAQYVLVDTTDPVCNTLSAVIVAATPVGTDVTGAPGSINFTGSQVGGDGPGVPGLNLPAPIAGNVWCNQTPTASSPYTLTNHGALDATVVGWQFGSTASSSGAFGTSSIYTVTAPSPSAVPIPAHGGSVSFSFTALKTPTSLPNPTSLGDTFTVFVQGPTGTPAPYTVQLNQNVEGAVLTNLTLTPQGSNADALAFSATAVGQTGAGNVSLQNSGNYPATITLTSPAPTAAGFAFRSYSQTITPGNTANIGATFTASVSASPSPSATSTLSFNGTPVSFNGTPVCEGGLTSSQRLELSGTVSSFPYSLCPPTPCSYDLAKTCCATNVALQQPCGQAVVTGRVNINPQTNPALPDSYSWSATVTGASGITVSPATGRATGTTSTPLTVTASPIPVSASTTSWQSLNATLNVVITPSTGMAETLTYPIVETETGIILAVSPAPIAITGAAGSSSTFYVSAVSGQTGADQVPANGLPISLALGASTNGTFKLGATALTVPSGNATASTTVTVTSYESQSFFGAASTNITFSSRSTAPPVCNSGLVVDVNASALKLCIDCGPIGPIN